MGYTYSLDEPSVIPFSNVKRPAFCRRHTRKSLNAEGISIRCKGREARSSLPIIAVDITIAATPPPNYVMLGGQYIHGDDANELAYSIVQKDWQTLVYDLRSHTMI